MNRPASTLPPRCFALVPCAGTGHRAGFATPKQYQVLGDRSVVAHTLAALAQVKRLAATLVVLAPDDEAFGAQAPRFKGPRAWLAWCGGATRAQSVAQGLAVLAERGVREQDWVLVHDAARCLVQPAWIDRLIDACLDDPVGGLLALPLADTLKEAAPVDEGPAGSGAAVAPRVAATLDRRGKWLAQTPQMFRLGLLREALASSAAGVTDEASAVEALGHAPRLVEGDAENFKLTLPGDFALAARLLATRPTIALQP